MKQEISQFSPAAKLFAVLLGVAVPAVAFGRAAFAVFIGLALIALLVARPGRDILADLWAQVKTPVGILVFATFAAWLPNVFVSLDPGRSFEAVFRTLIFVGVASAFCSYLSTDQRLITVALKSFTVAAAISIAFALISMTVLPEIFWAMHLKGWQSKPIGTQLKGFSALAVLIIPVLALAGYRAATGWKSICGIVALGFLVIVWDSYNRSAIAGLLASSMAVSLAVLVRSGTKRNVLITLGGVGALIAGTIVWLWVTRGFALRTVPQDGWFFPIWLIGFERQTIWSRALEFASASPWIGIGANTINFVPGADEIIKGSSNLHVIPAHPHNWSVEIFAETGAVGLGILALTIIVAGWRTLSNIRRFGGVGLVLALAAMAGYWGSGLFNFSYWSAWWQMSFLVTLAFCYACACSTDGSTEISD